MSSSIDLERAVGVELDVEPVRNFNSLSICHGAHSHEQVAWNTRDLLLYAVGIGAKKDDLAMVYGADNFP